MEVVLSLGSLMEDRDTVYGSWRFQILQMTGMGEYVGNILQLIRCFTPDGSTDVALLMGPLKWR